MISPWLVVCSLISKDVSKHSLFELYKWSKFFCAFQKPTLTFLFINLFSITNCLVDTMFLGWIYKAYNVNNDLLPIFFFLYYHNSFYKLAYQKILFKIEAWYCFLRYSKFLQHMVETLNLKGFLFRRNFIPHIIC